MVVSEQKIETAQDARCDAKHCNQESYPGHGLSFGFTEELDLEDARVDTRSFVPAVGPCSVSTVPALWITRYDVFV